MIKTTYSVPTETIVFPLLARAVNDGLTVLFTDKMSGIVIHPGTSCNKIGYFSTSWLPYTKPIWQILPPGTRITLEVC